MIPADIRLYTWVDVEEVLIQALKGPDWPDWLVWAQAYWDGLTLGIRPEKEEAAKEWLYAEFDPRFDKEKLVIKLESVNEDDVRELSVSLEITDEEVTSHRFKPSFARSLVIRPFYEQEHPTALSPDLPPVIAFHSFKGGVGRTLHALALAFAMVKKGRTTTGYEWGASGWGDRPAPVNESRILLVDADLEAPGLSWLVSKKLPRPPVSFVDFLALIHSDPDPSASESVNLVANRLKDALVDGIFILPAFRSSNKFNSIDIKPEHLIQGSKDPFILTTMLSTLGKVLNADAVIVDLRAGLSELSSSLLLDPRVYRVLVTTLSGQSIEGTCQLLKILGEHAPSKNDEDPLPALILSQIPLQFKKGDLLDQYYERLLIASNSIRESLEGDQNDEQLEEITANYLKSPLISDFDSNLFVLPDEWDEVRTRIHKSDLIEKISEIIDWLPGLPIEVSPAKSQSSDLQEKQSSDLQEKRKNLATYSRQLVYAEKGKIDDFLTITPLRNLAFNFSANVPIAVIIGAKGSGKTYTYLQMALRKNWKEFAQNAGSKEASINALICPVLKSKNLEESANQIVYDARCNSSEELGLSNPCDLTDIYDYVRDGLKENLHEGQWRERWLNILAWNLGFEVKKEGAGRKFADYLRSKKQHVVMIIDGLEDLFLQVSSNENEQTAVRALLQDVPEWLEQQPARPIGLLVFVRQDIVLNAITQNYAQLIAKYDTYSLKWSAEEALRLITWIAIKADILENKISDPELQEMNTSKLTDKLIPLWGRKLGRKNSREARSATWVITALSDLKGQIQARDLVRFLYIASQASIGDTYWFDRLIVPTATRKALSECSKEKLTEIEMENETLKDIFSKLRKLDDKQVPFTLEQTTNLTLLELKILENNGVVLREDEEYYMPEIFRLGLNFRLKVGAKPRVLTLARRAQKWNR